MKPDQQITLAMAQVAAAQGCKPFIRGSDYETDCTLTDLERWFRDERKIHIEIKHPEYTLPYRVGKILHSKAQTYQGYAGNTVNSTYQQVVVSGSAKKYATYNEALEAGLQKALDYIST